MCSFDTLILHILLRKSIDEEIVDEEEREAVIGMTADWRLLYVVYVIRKEAVRIISARLVTKAERKSYEEQ